jgi:hypothetical protein
MIITDLHIILYYVVSCKKLALVYRDKGSLEDMLVASDI